jgi:hypothetical protein
MKKIFKWLGERAKERSTYVGLGMVASVAGAPALGLQINHIGQVVALIVGSGLATATTNAGV